jgi:hypothetical protein
MAKKKKKGQLRTTEYLMAQRDGAYTYINARCGSKECRDLILRALKRFDK